VAEELGIDAGEIDVHDSLTRYGMDSMTAVVLTGELEHWLGRTVPPDLLGEYATVESLAQHLAEPGEPTAAVSDACPAAYEPEVEPLVWQRRAPSFLERMVRRLTIQMARWLMRIQVEGLEKVPASGPLILACNHLHIIDTPVVFSVVRRSTVFFVSDHMLQFPLVGWYLRQLGQSIYVARGKADRQALGRALAALQAGETLVIAPEGRISRTGGLLQGQTGAAFLASRSGAPIIPLVVFGQEQAGRRWRRLGRPRVNVRIGEPMSFAVRRATTRQLEEYTEKIMLALADMLPDKYRGFYTRAEVDNSSGVSTSPPPSQAGPRGVAERGS